jgi:hypothetical protein
VFLDELLHWDGSNTRDRAAGTYSSSVRENVDWIQALATLHGQHARIRPYTSSKLQKKVNWQIDFAAPCTTTLLTSLSKTARTMVPFNGRVYCVSVPSSFIVIRHGQNAMITGQCQNFPEMRDREPELNLRRQVVASPGGHPRPVVIR